MVCYMFCDPNRRWQFQSVSAGIYSMLMKTPICCLSFHAPDSSSPRNWHQPQKVSILLVHTCKADSRFLFRMYGYGLLGRKLCHHHWRHDWAEFLCENKVSYSASFYHCIQPVIRIPSGCESCGLRWSWLDNILVGGMHISYDYELPVSLNLNSK
jgi:hypothetical protein